MLPPKEFITIKQPKGSKICTACVTAMASGESLTVVEQAMQPTPIPDGSYFYRTSEMLKFLGGRGIFCGMTFGIGCKLTESDVSLVVPVEFTMNGHPSIISVSSQTYEEAEHFVFWDGKHIRDPNPFYPEITPIDLYHILEIIPITYINDTAELNLEKFIK